MTIAPPAPLDAPLDGGDRGSVQPTGRALLFEGGLPGFPDARHFTLAPWGGDGSPFSVLECADRDGLAFVVAPPALFFAGYEPVFDAPTRDRLGLRGPVGPGDVEVLVILTLGEQPADATANLLGPVVVNARTGAAVQAVLGGTRWSARAALVP